MLIANNFKLINCFPFLIQYGCCGKIGPSDYTPLSRPIPKSCYPNKVVDNNHIFTTGCIKAAQDKYVELFAYASSGEWFVLAISVSFKTFSSVFVFVLNYLVNFFAGHNVCFCCLFGFPFPQ